MLSAIADIVGAYFIAQKAKQKLLAVILCCVVGVMSAIVMNLAIYAIASDSFTPGEILTRIFGGMVIHPAITLIAYWVWMRKRASSPMK